MEAHVTATTRACGRRTSARLALTGDERLAQLAGAGDERACAVLYDRYHQQLYRYCRSILRNDADAQDALQSTMADAFGAIGRGRRDAPLRPWLFRIAHNESVSLLRKRRPEAKLAATSETQEAPVEELVEERQRLQLLIADLGELPDRQRGALVMRELGGLSHQEIGIAIGASVSAVKQAIFEARRSLAEFAEGRTMECEVIRRSISDADGRAMRARRIRAHLRDCSGCAAFAASISERRARLRAIALPLPATAATGVLVRILGGGSPHGGSSAGAFSGAATGKTVGLLIATKSLAGVATVVAVATLDATAILSKHHSGAGSSGRVHVSFATGRPRAGGTATHPHTLSAATGGASHAVRSTEGGTRGLRGSGQGRSTVPGNGPRDSANGGHKSAGESANPGSAGGSGAAGNTGALHSAAVTTPSGVSPPIAKGNGGSAGGSNSNGAAHCLAHSNGHHCPGSASPGSGGGAGSAGGNGAPGTAGGLHSPAVTTPSGVSPPIAKGNGGSPGGAGASHANQSTGAANKPTGNRPIGSHVLGMPATTSTPSSSADGANSNDAAHCLAHSNGNRCPSSYIGPDVRGAGALPTEVTKPP